MPEAIYLTLAGVFGLCIGSFLNVVIYRLPKQLQAAWARDSRDFLGISESDAGKAANFNVAFPASHCPKCGATLRVWHNIPVISYLLLRGKCSACSAPISFQYPLVELLSAAIAVFAFATHGTSATGFFVLVFCLTLLVLTAIDFQTQLLPDSLTLPLLWLGLIANSQGLFTTLESAVYGAIAGYLVLWLVYWGFKLLTGKEGMGYGDFKLLAALGAWVGWEQLPLIILLSSVVGAVIGVGMTAFLGRDRHIPMAFGPYLAIAGLISLLWGEVIVSTYMKLF